MKRLSMWMALVLVACAGVAQAQSNASPPTKAGTQAHASGSAAVSLITSHREGSAQATTGAEADAQMKADADASYQRLKQEIQARGARTSASARAAAEARFEASGKRVDEEASKDEAQVAARLAAEFKTMPGALLGEKNRLDAGWGELMIAYALSANAKASVTAEQLLQLRADHTGWGQIAAGLGLDLGDAANAAKAEARVAAGLAKPDGRVAVIHGEGARAGVGAGIGAGAGLDAGRARTSAGVGVGVRIKN